MQMNLRKLGIVVPRRGFKSRMKRVCGMTGDQGGLDLGLDQSQDFLKTLSKNLSINEGNKIDILC